MGFFVTLVCVCLCVCLGFGFCLRFYPQWCRRWPSDLAEAGFLYMALLWGCGLLYVGGFVSFFLVLLTGIGGLFTIFTAYIHKKWMYVLPLFICLTSVLMFPVFSGHTFLGALILTFLWGAIWGIFVFFDRFPFVSSLVSISWAFGLTCVGLVTRFVPEGIMALAALLGMITALLSRFRMRQKKANLGKMVALLVGFFWASIWVYFISKGAIVQTVTAFGYYIFECFFVIYALCFHQPMKLFSERFLMIPSFAAKATGILFSHLLILSFLSVMTMQIRQGISSVLLFALGVVLMDLYLRLNALVHPVPTWREMFQDVKNSVTTLTYQVGKRTSKEKAVSGKKPQKTPLNKKPIQKRKNKK